MADAWEIITANATDTSDAWAALNSQQTAGGTPGAAVDEIPFTLGEPIVLTAVLTPQAVTASPVETGKITAAVANVKVEHDMDIETLPIVEVY